MLAARRVGIGARGPRGPWQAATKLPTQLQSLYCSPPRFNAANRRLHPVLAPQTLSSRFFSQQQARQGFVATTRRVATGRDNKSLLIRSPDDAELARAVFRDLQDGNGATLTNSLAAIVCSALLKDGALRESVDVLEYARERDVHVDPKVYVDTFGAASRAKQYADVLRVWDAMQAGDYQHIPWQYRTALLAAVRLKQKKRGFEILDQVKANNVRDDEMFGLVLGVACQTRQHRLVGELLDYMHAHGVDPTTAYQSAIRLASKSGDHDLVLNLVCQMKEHDLDPTVVYKTQILRLDRGRSPEQVLSVFRAMQEGGCVCDEETGEAVVNSVVRVESRDVVLSVLSDMQQNANLTDIQSLLCRAVRAALWTNRHQLVLDIFDFMDQAGVDAYSAYVSATTTAFKSEQYDFVFDILRKMTETGLDASGEYSHVVISFTKRECYDHALRAFKAMREFGYEQDKNLCTTALRAAKKLNRHDDVTAIGSYYEHMPRHTSELVEAVKLKQKKRVFEILDDMKTHEVKDDQVYHHALGAACHTKQHELVCEILDYMHANGVDSTTEYRHATRLAFKLGEYDFVLDLLRLMKAHDMDPTDQCKSHIMSLHKAGLFDKLLGVFEAMQEIYCVCSGNIYGAAVDSAVRLKDRGLLLAILDSMKQTADMAKTQVGVLPHLGMDVYAVYVTAIRTAFKSKQYDLVFDILGNMKENGVNAGEDYSHAVMSFSKLNCYDHVLRAFKAMRELGYEQEEIMYTTALRAAVELGRDEDVLAIGSDYEGVPRALQKERVLELLEVLKADEVKDDEVYRDALGVACQTKQHDIVREILDHMHANGVDSTIAYHHTIRLAFKSGKLDFTLELCRLMKKHGMDPTDEYEDHILSLHKAGLHGHVLSAFTAMRNAECICDEDTYEAVVASAVRLMNRDVVFSVLDDMKQSVNMHETTSVVFPRAIGSAIWTNQHQLVLDIIDFMDQAGVDASAAYVSAIRTAFK